jgi:excisionase family DNA binding protein
MLKNQDTAKLEKKFYTTKDIMDLFSVDRGTVYNWKSKGVLQFTRIGTKYYVPRTELERFITNS